MSWIRSKSVSPRGAGGFILSELNQTKMNELKLPRRLETQLSVGTDGIYINQVDPMIEEDSGVFIPFCDLQHFISFAIKAQQAHTKTEGGKK